MIVIKDILAHSDFALFSGIILLCLALCIKGIYVIIKTSKDKQQHNNLIYQYNCQVTLLNKKIEVSKINHSYDTKVLYNQVSQVKDKVLSIRLILGSLNNG